MESVLPDYTRTMSTHDTMASKYTLEVIVHDAYAANWRPRNPPRDLGPATFGATTPRGALFTILH